MAVTCRALTDDELRPANELARVAFGGPRLRAEEPLPSRPGRVLWGAFDAGRMVAVAGDRVQSQWWGGRLIPAAGISSVAVAPEDRGRGHAQTLVAAVLAAARERGAVVSTLFPTAPALYRRLGWEETGVLTWWDVPTAALAGLRAPAGVTIRAATGGDVAAILAVHDAAATVGNGYLGRDADRFPGWPFHDDYGLDGVTVAVSGDGGVSGFMTWKRGSGYGAQARLEVHELIGREAAATTALLASIGSWGAVAPTVSLLLPRPDPAWWVIPARVAAVRSIDAWMTRVVDARAAVEARGFPAYPAGEVGLELTDDLCPWNAGAWTLAVSDGRGELRPGGDGSVTLGARGLGVLFAGGVSLAELERGGLATGESALLDALFAGPAPATLSYF